MNEERDALIAQGWTPPPEPVDPDIARAQHIWDTTYVARYTLKLAASAVFEGIKQGRALAAEAKPGMVWVKYDRSAKCPTYLNAFIWIRQKHSDVILVAQAKNVSWRDITHYAVITPPADDVA